jgi:hypothetical protein
MLIEETHRAIQDQRGICGQRTKQELFDIMLHSSGGAQSFRDNWNCIGAIPSIPSTGWQLLATHSILPLFQISSFRSSGLVVFRHWNSLENVNDAVIFQQVDSALCLRLHQTLRFPFEVRYQGWGMERPAGQSKESESGMIMYGKDTTTKSQQHKAQHVPVSSILCTMQ